MLEVTVLSTVTLLFLSYFVYALVYMQDSE